MGKLKTELEITLLKKHLEFIFSLSEEYNDSKKVILDLGSGSGAKFISAIFSLSIKDLKRNIFIASDLDLIGLKRIQKEINREISVIQQDLKSLSYKENSINLVSMIQAFIFRHEVDLNIFFAEIRRILKSNGLFIFTLSNRRSYKGFLYRLIGKVKQKFYVFSYHEIAKMLENNRLNPIEIVGYNFLPYPRNSDSKLLARLLFLEKWLRSRKSLKSFAPNLIVICKAI